MCPRQMFNFPLFAVIVIDTVIVVVVIIIIIIIIIVVVADIVHTNDVFRSTRLSVLLVKTHRRAPLALVAHFLLGRAITAIFQIFQQIVHDFVINLHHRYFYDKRCLCPSILFRLLHHLLLLPLVINSQEKFHRQPRNESGGVALFLLLLLLLHHHHHHHHPLLPLLLPLFSWT